MPFILGIAALTTSRDHVILQPNHWLKWQEVGVVLKIRPDPVVPNETFAKMSSINLYLTSIEVLQLKNYPSNFSSKYLAVM